MLRLNRPRLWKIADWANIRPTVKRLCLYHSTTSSISGWHGLIASGLDVWRSLLVNARTPHENRTVCLEFVHVVFPPPCWWFLCRPIETEKCVVVASSSVYTQLLFGRSELYFSACVVVSGKDCHDTTRSNNCGRYQSLEYMAYAPRQVPAMRRPHEEQPPPRHCR